jgi:predicted phage tail protein
MGFNPFKAASKFVSPVIKYFADLNPFVSLVISLGIAWLMRPKTPEMSDFGTNDFDNYEKGILLNKQSNDANIPVIYGERMIGGTRVFLETSGTDNEFLYMAIIYIRRRDKRYNRNKNR